MYSKVKRLRRGGERISDHEIAADPGAVGHMTICQVGDVIVAKLHAAGDDARKTAIFPELWRARIVAMQADACCSRATSAGATRLTHRRSS
jgi:hypothetical protein